MKNPAANEQIVARVQKSTGLTHREAQVAVLSTTTAIIDQLLEGKEVCLRNLGTFLFRMAKARKIPERTIQSGRVLPELLLPPRPKLKFKAVAPLERDLKGVIPAVIHESTIWSNARNKNNVKSL